jgi:hypothetical protein
MVCKHSPPLDRIPSLAACVAAAGVLTTLATAFLLILYACPAADDFFRAGSVHVQPWYRELAMTYVQWSGRWAGIGLAIVTLSRNNMMKWYPALLGILVFFQAIGLRSFWRILLGETLLRRQVLALTVVSMAVLWASLPSPGETYYWITGGIENQLNIWLALLLIGALVRTPWDRLGRGISVAWAVALALLAIFVTGFHELIGVVVCVVLASGTLIAFKSHRSLRRCCAWGLVTGSAVIGLVVVIAAPGNKARSAFVAATIRHQDQNLAHALEVAWGQAAAMLPVWLLDVRLLSAALLLVLSPSLVRAPAVRIGWGRISPQLVASSIWILVVAAMFLGPSYILHAPMPGRTQSAAYTLFALGLITTTVVGVRARAGSDGAPVSSPAGQGLSFARSGALIIVGLSLVLTGNTHEGIAALSRGVPQTWHRMIHWRDGLIKRELRSGAVEVDLPIRDIGAVYLARWPQLYNFYDITDDPTWFINQHVARYYGLKTIRRVPRGASVAAKARTRSEVIGQEPLRTPTRR